MIKCKEMEVTGRMMCARELKIDGKKSEIINDIAKIIVGMLEAIKEQPEEKIEMIFLISMIAMDAIKEVDQCHMD